MALGGLGAPLGSLGAPSGAPCGRKRGKNTELCDDYVVKGFQVFPRDLQNLENDGFTIVKPLFSEMHLGLKKWRRGTPKVDFQAPFGPLGPTFGASSAHKVSPKTHWREL